MSSASWIYNARRNSFDLPKKLQALIAKFNAKITDDSNDLPGEELQSVTEGLVGKTYLKFCDADLDYLYGDLNTTSLANPSSPTFEPDYNQLKLWIEFDNTGGTVPDYSGFDHFCSVYGIGRMRMGYEYSRGTCSLENVFDGRSTYAEILDSPDLAFVNTDFTLQFRFLPMSLSHTGNARQVVLCKKDGFGNWYSFDIDFDGSCSFNLFLNGYTYSISTPASTITPILYGDIDENSVRYDVVVTWDNTNLTLTLYINNVAYTDVATAIPSTSKKPDYLGTNLQIGRYTAPVAHMNDTAFVILNSDYVAPITYTGNGVFLGLECLDTTYVMTSGIKYPPRFNSKLYYGTFQQLKFFNRVLTPDEVNNHYINRVSITDIDRDSVAIPEGVVILAP